MNALALLLIVKILVKTTLVAIPCLMMPKQRLDKRMGFGKINHAGYRLYGMATLALVVAYLGGMLQALEGTFPAWVIAMSAVSSGGSTIVLYTSYTPKTPRWVPLFFLLMTISLVLCIVFRDAVMVKLF